MNSSGKKNVQPMHHKVFQIFRTGVHTGMSGATLAFSKQDLEYIAAGYSKARMRAPLVLGHPPDNIPEFGEVNALFVTGDALYAEASVSDNLIGMVRAGLYRNVSPSLITPTSPNNKTPGAYYLRAVGFLGAHPPAVKGMAAPSFSEGCGSLNFSEGHDIHDAIASANSVPFIPAGYSLCEETTPVFMLAEDYQRACPQMSFIEAVRRAESIIYPIK